MTKLTTATLALLLAGSLTACSKDAGLTTPAPAVSSASAGSVARSGAPTVTPTGPVTATPTVSSTGAPGGTAAPVPVDQSTPEAAMTSWLGAMVAGQGQTVCNVMAIKGQPIKDIKGAAQACGEKITPMLEKMTALGGAFTGLKITGATVTGATASFDSVTTTPALAADVVSSFKAVKVDGKWYVSQG